MTEILEESEYNINESFSISEPTIKADLRQSEGELKYDEIVKNYPIRCPDCWDIPRLNFSLNSNVYSLICDENHKNMFMSFKDLLENADKKFSSLLCHQCKKESDVMYRCNENNLFFCSECIKNYDSNNFIEAKDIDTTCPIHHSRYKFYDKINHKNICQECLKQNKENLFKMKNFIETEKYANYQETIDKYHKKAIENLKMWNNISNITKTWLKNLNDKFQEFLSSISNYCLLQLKLVNYLKTENSYQIYNNNFNIYSNYEAINNENEDFFIRKINEYLNIKYNENLDICILSTFFINILNEYNKNDIQIESKINIDEEKDKLEGDKNQIKKEIKLIKDMKKKRFELKEKVNCLIPFEYEKYIILGYNTGEIAINKILENELKDELRIKEFKNEITHLCELDKLQFVASDVKLYTKIIQVNENMKTYEVVKNIDIRNYKKISRIISIPMISYFKNRQYFAIGIDNYALIYKSNKMPQKLEPPYVEYHGTVEEFSIVQPSFIHDNDKLNYKLENKIAFNNNIEDILEISDKYLAITFTDLKILKLMNTQNEFKYEKDLNNLIPNNGCSMKLSKSRKELIIGYNGGFNIIELNNLQKIRNVKISHNIKFLDFIDYNCLMCLTSSDDNIYIKQYKFNKGIRDMNKISEMIVLNQNDITNFAIIQNKIYYIDKSNIIHYYE